MKLNIIFIFSSVFILSACFGFKPFQPGPPEYKRFIKEGVNEQGVKEAMRKCGYPNVVGRVSGDKINDRAKMQICMFENGFKLKDGSKGICSWVSDKANVPACQEVKGQ